MARLIDTATNESGDAARYNFKRRGTYRPVQAIISAVGTAVVEGKASGDLDWQPLHTFTESGIENVLVMWNMRVTVTDNTGQVTVELDA